MPVFWPVLMVRDNRRLWNTRSRGYRARALPGTLPGSLFESNLNGDFFFSFFPRETDKTAIAVVLYQQHAYFPIKRPPLWPWGR